MPLTLAEDDTAFVHWDVLTDNADNNSTVDVNTGVWTYNAVVNSVPDVNVNSPNGVQYISQYRNKLDTNTLIDFNVSDADGAISLLADIYISTNQNSFTTVVVIINCHDTVWFGWCRISYGQCITVSCYRSRKKDVGSSIPIIKPILA